MTMNQSGSDVEEFKARRFSAALVVDISDVHVEETSKTQLPVARAGGLRRASVTCATVEIDLPRKKYIWVIMVTVVLLVQAATFYTALKEGAEENECTTYFPRGRNRPARPYTNSEYGEVFDNNRYGIFGACRHAFLIWPCAMLLTCFLDHRGRFDRSDSMKAWARAYGLSILLYVVLMYARVFNVSFCAALTGGEEIFCLNYFLLNATRVVYMISLVILNIPVVEKVEHLNDGKTEGKDKLMWFAMASLVRAVISFAGGAYSGIQLVRYGIYFTTFWTFLFYLDLAKLEVEVFYNAASLTETDIKEMESAAEQAKEEIKSMKIAARWIRITGHITLASAFTTVLFQTFAALNIFTLYRFWPLQACASLALCLDVTCNCACALVMSELVGPRVKQDAASVMDRFVEMSMYAVRAKQRKIFDKVASFLKEEALGRSADAAVIAALMDTEGEFGTEEILEQAQDRFRCIKWDVLKKNSGIIIDGGLLENIGAGDASLLDLSEPCALADCDVFVSHSWRDDAMLKWDALSKWCEQFRRQNGRYPTLWLDKVCIDQQNIDLDLRCLPVFLAGCRGLIVFAGDTYISRLWCTVELFVYIAMQDGDASDADYFPATVLALGDTFQDTGKVWNTFKTKYDANECQCFKQEDKERLLRIIAQGTGGIPEFNVQVRRLLTNLDEDPYDTNIRYTKRNPKQLLEESQMTRKTDRRAKRTKTMERYNTKTSSTGGSFSVHSTSGSFSAAIGDGSEAPIATPLPSQKPAA
jgi:hypothetical protein